MFPFPWNVRNWPSQSPSMEASWGPMFSTSSMAPTMMQNPQGQFCSPDPMTQQAQAQSQAQIQALNQPNALLNQQLHTQHVTHMQNLQNLQQLASQSSLQPSSNFPPVTGHTGSHPSPSQADSTPPVPTPTAGPPAAQFNNDEMINQVKQSIQDGLAAAAASSLERRPLQRQHQTQSTPPTPPPLIRHTPPSELPPSVHRRFRSPPRGVRSPARGTRSPVPDKRALSSTRSPRRERGHRRYRSESRRSPRHPKRPSSVQLRSATPSRRGTSTHSRHHSSHDIDHGHRSLSPRKHSSHFGKDDTWTSSYPVDHTYRQHPPSKWSTHEAWDSKDTWTYPSKQSSWRRQHQEEWDKPSYSQSHHSLPTVMPPSKLLHAPIPNHSQPSRPNSHIPPGNCTTTTLLIGTANLPRAQKYLQAWSSCPSRKSRHMNGSTT